jgi:hypothetical protein
MRRPRLHVLVFAGPARFALAIALVSLSLFGAGARGDSANCSGLGGDNKFSDHLAQRTRYQDLLCSDSGQVKTAMLQRLEQKLEFCSKLAQLGGIAWSDTPMKTIKDRYEEACFRYKRNVQISTRICSTYAGIAANVPASPSNVNGVEAMKAAAAPYNRLSCQYGLLEKSAWFSEPATFVGASKGGGSPSEQDAAVSAAKNQLVAAIPTITMALQQKMAGSKFPESARASVSRASAACNATAADVKTFEDGYQSRIYKEIVGMYADGEKARKFFASQKESYAGMVRSLTANVSQQGEVGAASPTLVKPSTADPSVPNAESCPADTSLNDVQKNIQQSTFRADKSTGEIGTTFRAQTTGANGQPVFHDVTASHVVLEDFHDPDNQTVAGVKVEPAGQMMDPGTPKVFENNPATIDREHDVAMAPTGYGPALPVKADDANPKVGQEFTVAGHPVDGYESNYVNMSCNFMGYGSGEQSGYYVVSCPTNNASIGGVSGGPMVDPKTGQVWGVATNQGSTYDANNDWVSRDNRVFVSPIQQGKNGQIQTGPQRYDSGYCYETEGAVPRACHVTPMGVSYD